MMEKLKLVSDDFTSKVLQMQNKVAENNDKIK